MCCQEQERSSSWHLREGRCHFIVACLCLFSYVRFTEGKHIDPFVFAWGLACLWWSYPEQGWGVLVSLHTLVTMQGLQLNDQVFVLYTGTTEFLSTLWLQDGTWTNKLSFSIVWWASFFLHLLICNHNWLVIPFVCCQSAQIFIFSKEYRAAYRTTERPRIVHILHSKKS